MCVSVSVCTRVCLSACMCVLQLFSPIGSCGLGPASILKLKRGEKMGHACVQMYVCVCMYTVCVCLKCKYMCVESTHSKRKNASVLFKCGLSPLSVCYYYTVINNHYNFKI